MGIREQLAKRSKLTAAISIVIALLGIGAVIYSSREPRQVELANTYFSEDDGKTFFADRLENVLPFQKRATPAYRAIVCSCEPGGDNRFVGYLARSTAQDVAAIEDAKEGVKAAEAKYAFNDVHVSEAQDALAAAYKAANDNLEVKRPGASNKWVPASSPEGDDVVNHMRCPGGRPGTPLVVLP
jgi:hypothetical protein